MDTKSDRREAKRASRKAKQPNGRKALIQIQSALLKRAREGKR